MKTKIIGLLDTKGNIVDSLDKDVEGYVILERSPFFPGGGGQVCDTGVLCVEGSVVAIVDEVFTLHKGY